MTWQIRLVYRKQRSKGLSKKDFGMPLHQYIMAHRLDKAAQRIKSGANIAQPAIETGFSSQASTSAMRAKQGKTPAALQVNTAMDECAFGSKQMAGVSPKATSASVVLRLDRGTHS